MQGDESRSDRDSDAAGVHEDVCSVCPEFDWFMNINSDIIMASISGALANTERSFDENESSLSLGIESKHAPAELNQMGPTGGGGVSSVGIFYAKITLNSLIVE